MRKTQTEGKIFNGGWEIHGTANKYKERQANVKTTKLKEQHKPRWIARSVLYNTRVLLNSNCVRVNGPFSFLCVPRGQLCNIDSNPAGWHF